MTKNEQEYIEVEAKYRINKPGIASHLLSPSSIVPGFTAGPIFIKTNVDTYYDTDEVHLLQAGIALRVRRTISTCLITVKTVEDMCADAVLQRTELESYVDPNIGAPPFLAQTPVEMQRLVESSLSTGDALQPILSLYQERVKRLIYAAGTDNDGLDNNEVAELSIDNVWVLANHDVNSVVAADTEDSVYHFTELELELAPNGNRASFDRLVASISSSTDIEPSKESKLQVGLRAIGRISD